MSDGKVRSKAGALCPDAFIWLLARMGGVIYRSWSVSLRIAALNDSGC